MTVVSRILVVVVLATTLTACDDSPTAPSGGALVTFRVVNESFRVWLNTPEQIAAARAAQADGAARIPNGRIATGTQFNSGWSWHREDVEFAEATIELCDGIPSDVEKAGTAFGGGRYCPWGATITRIEQQ